MAKVLVQDKLTFAATLTAVSCSRVFTKSTLTKWGATSILDDALLVVSELVTNAVTETGISDPDPTWPQLQQINVITVRIVGLEASIVFEVWDVSPKEPTLNKAAFDDEGGRGLFLVEQLADEWGFYAHRGGKVVWAELPVNPRTSDDLPRRRKSPCSTPQPAGEKVSKVPDVALLERVIAGLKALPVV